MKKIILITVTAILSQLAFAQSEKGRKIPSVDIKTIDQQKFNTSGISNDGKPIIISFWATWCKPCVKELSNIMDVYDEWQEETGVKLVAISIDDARNVNKVAPYVSGKGWEYEVYLDPNGDFKRAMNVITVPHTFIANGENQIVWQHNAYSEGDEDELFELVKKVAGK